MKYLVTFAWTTEIEFLKKFRLDAVQSYPIKKDFNKINLHSIIFKIDENNKLSDKIKEVKEAFFNNEKQFSNTDYFQCIGMTPIVNDEIEQAIKNSFGNYKVKDEIEMNNHFNEITKQLFSIKEEVISEIFSKKAEIIQIHIPYLHNLIDWMVLHIEFNHSYDELKEYLESKIANIDEKFQEVYKNLVLSLLDIFYYVFYACCQMPNKEYIRYYHIERNILMQNYSFIWKEY